MRLFVAIELSDAVRRALLAIIRTQKPKSRDVRWVGESQLHITLRFLGDVDVAAVEAVKQAVIETSATIPAFSIRLAGLGGFPNSRSPRVLWAGVDDPAASCARWVADAEPRFIALGFEGESRPFTPHITLARSSSPKGNEALASALRAAPFIEPLETPAKNVTLFQSELLPTGARYTALLHAPLRR